MITLLKRLPAALLTSADWAIIFHGESHLPNKPQHIKFLEIQIMRSGDRHDADYFYAQAEFKNEAP